MKRTRRSTRMAWLPAVAWAFAGALALSLAQPSEAAAQGPCSPYISGGAGHPASGTLVGYSRVTMTIGVSAGLSASYSVSFHVGTYRLHDDSYAAVRCDDYSVWVGFV